MRTLLLVDDVITTLAVTKSFLESRDFKVFVTTSAQQVLELASGVNPDLIILDFEMPEMNGDEVCRQLKAGRATAHIPVMILSAHTDEKTRSLCLDAGASAVLKKSSGRESLLENVVAALGIPQRKHVRVPCAIKAGLSTKGQEVKGLIHNMSVSGLYVTLNSPMEEGAALRVRFMLPGGAIVNVLGEIVRSETLSGALFGYGIQMLEADEGTLAAIKAYAKTFV